MDCGLWFPVWPKLVQYLGLPRWLSGKESACQCRRCRRHRFLSQEDPLEEEMATHSSILAWKIPRTKEPSGVQSMGLQRVGHDWATEHTHNSILSKWQAHNKHPFNKWRNDWIPSRLTRSFLKRIPGMGLLSWVMRRFKPVSDCPPSLSPPELKAQLKTNTHSWGPTLIHLWAEFGLPDAGFWNPLSRSLEIKWRRFSKNK